MDALLAAGDDGLWHGIYRAAWHGVEQADQRRARDSVVSIAGGKNRRFRRISAGFKRYAAVCRYILWADGDAHAARNHRSDLSRRGRVQKMVSSCDWNSVACWLSIDPRRQCFSLRHSRTVDLA